MFFADAMVAFIIILLVFMVLVTAVGCAVLEVGPMWIYSKVRRAFKRGPVAGGER